MRISNEHAMINHLTVKKIIRKYETVSEKKACNELMSQEDFFYPLVIFSLYNFFLHFERA